MASSGLDNFSTATSGQGDPVEELPTPPASESVRVSDPIAPNDDPSDGNVTAPPWTRSLVSVTATSWYLSLTVHIVGYVLAAVLFYFVGQQLLPDEEEIQTTTIRASLDEFDQFDESPALQIVSDIGPVPDDSESSMQQIANQLQTVQDSDLQTIVSDAKVSVTGAQDPNERAAGDTFFYDIPESGKAVTKGSFTAWTDPENPAPGQRYQIIIEMKLPRSTKRYRTSDLSGRVVGTDGYRQLLPYDSRKPYSSRITAGAEPETISSRTRIDVEKRKIQLVIQVPGARRLVKDTIEIQSRLLKEDQELELIFGKETPDNDDSEPFQGFDE